MGASTSSSTSEFCKPSQLWRRNKLRVDQAILRGAAWIPQRGIVLFGPKLGATALNSNPDAILVTEKNGLLHFKSMVGLFLAETKPLGIKEEKLEGKVATFLIAADSTKCRIHFVDGTEEEYLEIRVQAEFHPKSAYPYVTNSAKETSPETLRERKKNKNSRGLQILRVTKGKIIHEASFTLQDDFVAFYEALQQDPRGENKFFSITPQKQFHYLSHLKSIYSTHQQSQWIIRYQDVPSSQETSKADSLGRSPFCDSYVGNARTKWIGPELRFASIIDNVSLQKDRYCTLLGNLDFPGQLFLLFLDEKLLKPTAIQTFFDCVTMEMLILHLTQDELCKWNREKMEFSKQEIVELKDEIPMDDFLLQYELKKRADLELKADQELATAVTLSLTEVTSPSVSSTPIELDNSSTLCCVCYERAKSQLALPCKHLVLCKDCSVQITVTSKEDVRCPICRAIVVTFIEVYL